jgi:hypothetical protein
MSGAVTQAAIEAARQYFGYPLPPADASYVVEAAKHIAKAIAEEREYLAKLVDQRVSLILTGNLSPEAASAVLVALPDAIRASGAEGGR